MLPVVNPKAGSLLEMDGGWRKVKADGQNYINPDAYVIQNKFSVPDENLLEFEKKFVKSSTETTNGFVGFYLQRRDANKADDGFNYISTSIWNSKTDYEAWKNSSGNLGQQSCPQCPGSLTVPSSVAYFEGKMTIYGPM